MRAGGKGRDDADDSVRFGVLFYVNRSGSTLLSRLLSEASDALFVFPEVSFPLTLLLERRMGRTVAGEQLLAVIRADPRRDALTLSDATLARICMDSTSGDVEALLARIATACHGRRPAAALIKLESLLYVAADLDEAFANPVFFHLVRDPRAVANSMMRTPVPEKPSFTMARGSIWYTAAHWRRYVNAVAALASMRGVTEYRYETLRETADAICADMLGKLQLVPSGPPGGRTSFRLGEIDTRLHPLVFADFAAGRVDAWHDELSPNQSRVVELICRAEMARYGYDPGSRPLARDGALLRRARVGHVGAMAIHGWRTAIHYARRGQTRSFARRLLLMFVKRATASRRPRR